jgi:hypothetical protein
MALLLTAPAMARVDISCAQVNDTNVVEVTYSTEGEIPRAFALNIELDSGADIADINEASDLFWVYPGTIEILDGEVDEQGSPVAPQDTNYPGRELAGLGSDGMTIEMGSLWHPNDVDHSTQPGTTGTLISFIVSGDCNVAISGNSARGEVVLEDTTAADANYVGCQVVVPSGECFPSGHPDYAEWVSVGKPDSWCIERQCHGDADGLQEQVGFFSYYVAFDDLDALIDNWQTNPTSDPGLSADFSHSTEQVGFFTYRVAFGDLSLLLDNWQSNPDANCLDY